MSTPTFKSPSYFIAVAWLLQFFLTIEAYAQKVDLKQLKPLHYRHIGPVGNRIISVVGIPGDPMVYYVGAASQQKFNQMIDRDIPAIQEQLRKNNAGGPFIIKNTTRPN